METDGRRRMKDSTVICLLIFTWLFTSIVVIGADTKMTNFENRLEEVYGQHDGQLSDHRDEVKRELNEVKSRLSEVEHETQLQGIRLVMHRQMLDEIASDVEVLDGYLPTPTPIPQYAVNVTVSEEDIRNLAALVYLEAGSQSYRCQKAIASVLFNRMMRYGKTASQVIWEDGVFSPASRVRSTTPSASCVAAVREVLSSGCTLPRNVLAFRNNHYHTDFGHPYCRIQNVYFSTV